MSQGWAGEHARGMRNPLGCKSGCCGAGRGGLTDRGGSAAVESAPASVFVPRGWPTGYDNSCNRKRGYVRGSPGVESDGARRRRDVGGEVVPRVAAALEGEAAAVELRPF